MSVRQVRQLDHAAPSLSTPSARATARASVGSASEHDNALRYAGGPAGHVESHFLKANSPDGERAIWIKHTLLVPAGQPEHGVAEVWAVAFADRGRRKLARKQSYAVARAEFVAQPFSVALPSAQLGHGWARGELAEGADGRGDAIAWDLTYPMPSAGFRPFPHAAMYSGPFPRSKTLTPAPDTRVRGQLHAFGETWALDSWRGAQGHNWGASHAHAYAWVHASGWQREPGSAHSAPLLEDTWLEALSGRVRLGPVVTPFLSVAGVTIEGRCHRFDGLRALCSRRVHIGARSFGFQLEQQGVRLTAEFSAQTEQFAGLRYDDPDGARLACLNSKLATGQLTLSEAGRSTRLYTHMAALELGTRTGRHGIELLV